MLMGVCELSTVNVVITGATGMVGGLVLEQALNEPRVGAVTTLGRRATGVASPKLTEIEHPNFENFTGLEEVFAGQDVALFCLGAYTGSVPDDVFKRITVDYTVAFGEALRRANPGAVFCLLSGQGADSKETSRISFARYKGMAENALVKMGFSRVHLFRPGYIYPVTPRDKPIVWDRLVGPIWPLVRAVVPNGGIASHELAKAMLMAGLEGTPQHEGPVLENRDIRTLVAG